MYISQRLSCVTYLCYLFLCTEGEVFGGDKSPLGFSTAARDTPLNCSNALDCTTCVKPPNQCVWCLVMGRCIPASQQGQCQNPYTDCCVTFSPQGCQPCLQNPTCGWCEHNGCRQGNKTGPTGNTGPCTTQWTFGSGCPGSGDSGADDDLAVLIGVGAGVAIGTCFSLFVITLLVMLVLKRWRQREAQKDLMQYEKKVRRKSQAQLVPTNAEYVPAPGNSTPDSYSSLAPLIRDWNIEHGHTDYETLKRVEEATKD